MTIRFKCPHCQKSLAVKDELAGRRGACPACKKAILIPPPTAAPAAVDIEAMAAAALAEEPQDKPAAPVAAPIKFVCAFCDEENEFPADMAGKQAPCPSCKRIVKVPLPKVDKPKDWRELIKKGPSAALINQPEQLDDAWGTEVKTKVSGRSLEEAGAIVEYVEPVGILGWAKRGFFTLLLAAVVGGGYLIFSHKQSVAVTKNSLEVALLLVDPKNKDAKPPPLLAAEIHRGAGVIHLRDGKGDVAQRHFESARAYISNNQPKDDGPDFDLSLIDLALAQCELGGNKEEILGKERFDWPREVQPDLEATLGALRNTEAKVWAVRILGTRLLAKNQGAVANALATGLANTTPPVKAPQVALMLARDDKDAVNQLKLPADLSKGIADPLARSAYAEGRMRKGQFEDAKVVVQASGLDRDRFDACLAAGSIAADDPNKKTEAEFFFKEAQQLVGGMEVPPTSWQRLQLAKLGLAVGALEETKDLAKKLTDNFRARWQLEIVRAELAKASGSVPTTLVEEVTDEKSIHRALAWGLVARHHARLGRSAEVTSAAAQHTDPSIQAMIHLGLALGEQDRRQ